MWGEVSSNVQSARALVGSWLEGYDREEVPIEALLSLAQHDPSFSSSKISHAIFEAIFQISDDHADDLNIALFLASELPWSTYQNQVLRCCECRIKIQTSFDPGFDPLLSSILVKAASKVTNLSSTPPVIKLLSLTAQLDFSLFFNVSLDLLRICLSSPSSSALISTIMEESLKTNLALIFFFLEHLRHFRAGERRMDAAAGTTVPDSMVG